MLPPPTVDSGSGIVVMDNDGVSVLLVGIFREFYFSDPFTSRLVQTRVLFIQG